MSAVVSPIGSNPRIRIARLVRLLVERQRLAALETDRVLLPLDDPDRHALDVTVDSLFARMACEHPEACTCEPGGAA